MTSKSVRSLFIALFVLSGAFVQTFVHGQEPIFSGPQVGEKLPQLPAKGLTGEQKGHPFEVLEKIENRPALLVFFHSLTRPAFGMTRALAKFAETKEEAGLQTFVIFLTDDPTATEKWSAILPKQMPSGPTYCISTDGIEGPGAYGLNRNMILTILVAKQGIVTANSALAQPQLQVDGPSILQAIVDATGGGSVPSIAELEQSQMAMNPNMRSRNAAPKQDDPQFTALLRKVINKQADEATVKKAAADVEAYVAEHEFARAELARISTTIVGSDKLANYGTAAAQEILRQWAKKYGDADKQQPAPLQKAEPKQESSK